VERILRLLEIAEVEEPARELELGAHQELLGFGELEDALSDLQGRDRRIEVAALKEAPPARDIHLRDRLRERHVKLGILREDRVEALKGFGVAPLPSEVERALDLLHEPRSLLLRQAKPKPLEQLDVALASFGRHPVACRRPRELRARRRQETLQCG